MKRTHQSKRSQKELQRALRESKRRSSEWSDVSDALEFLVESEWIAETYAKLAQRTQKR